jgi:hypothetical protein
MKDNTSLIISQLWIIASFFTHDWSTFIMISFGVAWLVLYGVER